MALKTKGGIDKDSQIVETGGLLEEGAIYLVAEVMRSRLEHDALRLRKLHQVIRRPPGDTVDGALELETVIRSTNPMIDFYVICGDLIFVATRDIIFDVVDEDGPKQGSDARALWHARRTEFSRGARVINTTDEGTFSEIGSTECNHLSRESETQQLRQEQSMVNTIERLREVKVNTMNIITTGERHSPVLVGTK